MGWVNDLVSGLGIPAGAATLAVAMYAGCAAAEKAARPEALSAVASLIRDLSQTRSDGAPKIAYRLFVWMFGEHHFSHFCVFRSLIATISFCLSIIIYVFLGGHNIDFSPLSYSHKYGVLGWLSGLACILFIFSFLPDYFALGKTRIILRNFQFLIGWRVLILFFVDFVLSIFISLMPIVAIAILSRHSLLETYTTPIDVFNDDLSTIWKGNNFSLSMWYFLDLQFKKHVQKLNSTAHVSLRKILPSYDSASCRDNSAQSVNRTKMFHVKHFGKVHNIGPRLVGLYGSRRRQSYCSLPALGPCREADRLLGGAEQGLRLVDALALFGRRIGIIDDPSAGLNIHRSILDDRGA